MGPILVKKVDHKKGWESPGYFQNDEFWGYSLINGQFKWSEGDIVLTKNGLEQPIKKQQK